MITMGKKSRSIKNKNKSAVRPGAVAANGGAPSRPLVVGVDNDSHFPFTEKGVYYAEPLQERPEPDMTWETISQQYMPKIPTTSSFCCCKTISTRETAFRRADGISEDNPFCFLNSNTRVCLTNNIIYNMRISQEIDSIITETCQTSSMSEMQLVDKVTVKGWVVLLANSIVLGYSNYRLGQTLNVVQELRAQVTNGALTDLDDQHLGIIATDLRLVLSGNGIRAACGLYQNRDLRCPQVNPLRSSNTTNVVNSAFLLDTIEVLANDLVKFCPKSPLGYWNLGYVARESVAKRKWHGREPICNIIFITRP